jgi:hypothetical protein
MLDPNHKTAFLSNISEALQRRVGRTLDPVIVVNPRIRRHVRGLVEHTFRNLGVLSYAEIEPDVHMTNLETIAVHSAAAVPKTADGPPAAGKPPGPTKTQASASADDGGTLPPDGSDDDANPGMSWVW